MIDNICARIHPKEPIISYWCQDCNKLLDIEIAGPIRCRLNCEEDIEIWSLNIDFSINCPKCDSFMISIDRLISRQIRSINMMGYETAYCCAGHNNMVPNLNKNIKDLYIHTFDIPYISFSDIQQNEKCKNIARRILSTGVFEKYIYIDDTINGIWTIRCNENIPNGLFMEYRNIFVDFVDTLILSLKNDMGE